MRRDSCSVALRVDLLLLSCFVSHVLGGVRATPLAAAPSKRGVPSQVTETFLLGVVDLHKLCFRFAVPVAISWLCSATSGASAGRAMPQLGEHASYFFRASAVRISPEGYDGGRSLNLVARLGTEPFRTGLHLNLQVFGTFHRHQVLPDHSAVRSEHMPTILKGSR